MNKKKFDTSQAKSRDQIRQEIVKVLVGFTADQWVEYLKRLSYGSQPNPSLELYSPYLIEQLFWIYNTLTKYSVASRSLFTDSLVQILRTTAPMPEESSLIHTLIHFIHETRPIEHRRSLELMIREESFKRLSFGSDNLQLLLIKAYIYLEDRSSLVLEDYVKKTVNLKFPFSLYLVLFYYGYLGRETMALNYLFEFLTVRKWTENEVLCGEVYTAMSDCIPRYVRLQIFLNEFLSRKVSIDQSNPNLADIIVKFITNIKNDHGNDEIVVSFLDDVVNNRRLSRVDAIDGLTGIEGRRLRTLLYEYVASKSENGSLTPDSITTGLSNIENLDLQIFSPNTAARIF